jgi:hypothetical protein
MAFEELICSGCRVGSLRQSLNGPLIQDLGQIRGFRTVGTVWAACIQITNHQSTNADLVYTGMRQAARASLLDNS